MIYALIYLGLVLMVWSWCAVGGRADDQAERWASRRKW